MNLWRTTQIVLGSVHNVFWTRGLCCLEEYVETQYVEDAGKNNREETPTHLMHLLQNITFV